MYQLYTLNATTEGLDRAIALQVPTLITNRGDKFSTGNFHDSGFGIQPAIHWRHTDIQALPNTYITCRTHHSQGLTVDSALTVPLPPNRFLPLSPMAWSRKAWHAGYFRMWLSLSVVCPPITLLSLVSHHY